MRGKQNLNDLMPIERMTVETMTKIRLIKKIENLQHLPPLERLNLSKNQIRKIEGLDSQINLRELNLSHNLIETVQELNQLPHLAVLNLAHNRISDIKGIQKLQSNKNLRTLLVEGNPLTNIQGYERIICSMLPFLVELDGKQTAEIKKAAEEKELMFTPLRGSLKLHQTATSVRKPLESTMRFASEFQINSLKEIIKDQEGLIKANITEDAVKDLLFAWQRKVFEALFEKQKNELSMIEWKKQQALNQERILIEAEEKFETEITTLRKELETARATIKELESNIEAVINRDNTKEHEYRTEVKNFKAVLSAKVKDSNEAIFALGQQIDGKLSQTSSRFNEIAQKLGKCQKVFQEQASTESKEVLELRKLLNIESEKAKKQAININQLKVEKEKLETDLSLLQRQYNSLSQELAELKQKAARKDQEALGEIEKLKTEVELVASECTNTRQLLTLEKESHKVTEQELTDWKQKYTKENSTLNEKYNKLLSENTQQTRQIDSLEKTIKSLNDSHNKELAEVELENRVQLRERDTKLKALKTERDSLLQKVNELKRAKAPVAKVDQGVMTGADLGIKKHEEQKVALEPRVDRPASAQSIKRLTAKLVTTNKAYVLPKTVAEVKKCQREEKVDSEEEDDSFQEPPPSARLIRKLEGIERTAKDALEDL